LEQLGLIELHLGAARGHMLVGGAGAPLPVGSTLKGGIFYWQAALGFMGKYDFLFERADATILRVHVKIQPKAYAARESP
jgi:hypothetical protein